MVIWAVEELAYCQGIKSLKVTGKNKVPLLPADWVAGVDHDKEIENGDDEDYMPTDDELQDEENEEMEAEDGIRDAQESRGLGDVYKRQRNWHTARASSHLR